MESKFNELQKKRRSIYSIGENVTSDKNDIFNLVKTTIQQSPTAFHSQTVRAVVLFGEKSNKVWDIVEANLRKVVDDDEAFKNTQAKIASFRAGFGTILYFTNTPKVHELEEAFPLYADNFATWAEQGIGGAQQAIWTALAEQGIGASLQHYNPLIDDDIKKEFDLPAEWTLRAQMPFGSIEAPAGDKEFLDEAEQFKLID